MCSQCRQEMYIDTMICQSINLKFLDRYESLQIEFKHIYYNISYINIFAYASFRFAPKKYFDTFNKQTKQTNIPSARV